MDRQNSVPSSVSSLLPPAIKYKGLFQSFGRSQPDKHKQKIPIYTSSEKGTFALVDRQKKNGVTERETFTEPSQYISKQFPAQNDKLPFTIAPDGSSLPGLICNASGVIFRHPDREYLQGNFNQPPPYVIK